MKKDRLYQVKDNLKLVVCYAKESFMGPSFFVGMIVFPTKNRGDIHTYKKADFVEYIDDIFEPLKRVKSIHNGAIILCTSNAATDDSHFSGVGVKKGAKGEWHHSWAKSAFVACDEEDK